MLTKEEIERIADMIATRISVFPRWMKASTATKYFGYGKQKLISLAEEGKISGFSDPELKRGDWIFDKRSIDKLRESQMYQENEKVLKI